MIYQVWSYTHEMWQDVPKKQFDMHDAGLKRIVKLEALISGPQERAATVKAREKREERQTLAQVIDGYRYGAFLGGIEERAAGIASCLSRGEVAVAVERIEGTMVHFVQHTMLEDFETWRLNGCLGDPIRFEISRFEIDMAPQNAG